MIELRWLVFESSHKVLQSRTRYVKETWTGEHVPLREEAWTEWADVPQLMAAIVNGERKVVTRAL
jgi:hypothetical protein